MNDEFKICKLCNILKINSEFHKNLNKDGHFNVCKKCHYIRNQKIRQDPLHKQRFARYQKSNSLYRRYGIYLEEYEQMVKEQNNKCLICNQKPNPDGKKHNVLSVDHCHKTNKIRGLLCHLCNRAIGLFRERIDLIEKALCYLKSH